ncbi:hypothetical protein ACOTDE_26985 [Achromobacter xylosoxidans]
MDVTRVVITDMPGAGWLELLLQWTGVLVGAAAAAGTVAAVVVALWQTRHAAARDEEKLAIASRAAADRTARLASLAAAALSPRLKALEDDVDLLLMSLSGYEQIDMSPEVFARLLNQFRLLKMDVPLEQLLLVESLPNNCADDAAAALARLSKVRADIERWEEAFHLRSTNSLDRMRVVSIWTSEISVALAALVSARKELDSASLSNLRHVAM